MEFPILYYRLITIPKGFALLATSVWDIFSSSYLFNEVRQRLDKVDSYLNKILRLGI